MSRPLNHNESDVITTIQLFVCVRWMQNVRVISLLYFENLEILNQSSWCIGIQQMLTRLDIQGQGPSLQSQGLDLQGLDSLGQGLKFGP